DLGVGEAHLVMAAGDYKADINGGIGSLVIEIPDEAQARIRASGGLGSIDISPRFQQQGIYYVTEGYRPSAAAILLDLDGGVGSIVVR
ncbi:MAG: hypothetical protein H5T69_17240, partial [Chloroflexi bacterium]|nr:hypothetical protein [Chloroflexota bacterium]